MDGYLRSTTAEIIGAAYEVANALGCGFLEKVYEHAMVVELAQRGLEVRQQAPATIRYKGQVIGEFTAGQAQLAGKNLF